MSYKVEYALSNRSTCKGCDGLIKQQTLRIAKMVASTKFDGEIPIWFHFDCFFKRWKGELSADSVLSGMEALRPEDNTKLKEMLKTFKRKQSSDAEGKIAKKPKLDTEEEAKYENAVKEEAKLLWNFKDKLGKVDKSLIVEMLELNNMPTTGSLPKIIQRAADGMLFGSLPVCPECDAYTVVCIDGVHFKCTGKETKWGSCTWTGKSIKRNPWKVSGDTGNSFLDKFKFVPRKEIKKLSKAESKDTKNTGANSGTQHVAGCGIKVSGGLFEGMVFCFAGTHKLMHKGLQALVVRHKGQFSPNMGLHVTHLVCSPATFRETPGKVRYALKHQITIIEEDWIHDSISKDLILDQSLYLLGGIIKDIYWNEASNKTDEDEAAKKVQKVIVKGVSAVDPDSGLSKKGHILTGKKDEVFNVMLNLTDLAKNFNSFYCLQVVEHDTEAKWYVFRKWGRIGTNVGGSKVEKFASKSVAIHEFGKLYSDKTGNEWADRNKFVKQPGKFFPLHIDFGDSDPVHAPKYDYATTSLKREVAELVETLFDLKAMQRTLRELEVDTSRMPLGKLTREHLLNAYSVLTKIQNLISDPDTKKSKLLEQSNMFYTLIPHIFGKNQTPVLIDNQRVLTKKIQMLDQLMEVQLASNLIKDVQQSSKKGDLLQMHFDKLNIECDVLDRKSREWDIIAEYIKNTHASTHNNYTLELQEVFTIIREGEEEDFVSDIDNKQLLWHGSRLSNFVGILSQGLRIAPPEAPVTGYMFGKGVYFADLVSKSANYCHSSKENPVGLLLLSEVALGKMYELTGAKFITKLPKGYSSCKGVGEKGPNPKKAKYLDENEEVLVPLGNIVKSGTVESDLLYVFILYCLLTLLTLLSSHPLLFILFLSYTLFSIGFCVVCPFLVVDVRIQFIHSLFIYYVHTCFFALFYFTSADTRSFLSLGIDISSLFPFCNISTSQHTFTHVCHFLSKH
eukprot:TRINITY_DN1143_c0_g3_i1.p1 TRINITY_DN1143_c0_g3~~TRINITY_DN1143_c0_g3_i1.p1  ORF type:complete len:959 (+),score=185.81 TRINITY_DN1143_c0_g3_i1:43-2919(+)